MAQDLYAAVERLDEDKRLVVQLHCYQGLSLRQTAKVLSIATSSVKYRLREAMKYLSSELGQD
jgi:RNA polymerase sigma-70 factor (ECF subfamily)